ncbi:MAG TPA: 30S ribosomal protein S6 [Phycisphaerales bacterium]|nr:30S ribosomal protein S6 [Phycisphaerales bacterium]
MTTAVATKKPVRIYQYEAMFLIGQSQTGDLAAIIQHIEEIMQRGHATVISMKKWDERRLAYEIKGQKRGLYILVYFKAPGESLSHIERDCNLSEKILRVMILRADHLTDDEVKAQDGRAELMAEAKLRAEKPQVAPAAPAAEAAAPAAE